MILTCPECSTSYFVEDARIPPAGRRVKCSSCGRRWTAGPNGPMAEADEPPADVDLADAAATQEPDETAYDDIVAEPAVEAEPEPALRPRPRPAAAAGRGKRPDSRSNALVWAGAAGVAAALIAGVIVFREQIVRLWPASSAAYAGLGLSIGGAGLVFEQVHAQPTFLAGRPVLSVTGAIRNVRDTAVDAPPVRVTLLNRSGQPVEAKIARPMDATIPARATRHFVITLLDPPATARDLEVRFETAGAGKAAQRAAEAVLAPTPAPLGAPPASPAPDTDHG